MHYEPSSWPQIVQQSPVLLDRFINLQNNYFLESLWLSFFLESLWLSLSANRLTYQYRRKWTFKEKWKCFGMFWQSITSLFFFVTYATIVTSNGQIHAQSLEKKKKVRTTQVDFLLSPLLTLRQYVPPRYLPIIRLSRVIQWEKIPPFPLPDVLFIRWV